MSATVLCSTTGDAPVRGGATESEQTGEVSIVPVAEAITPDTIPSAFFALGLIVGPGTGIVYLPGVVERPEPGPPIPRVPESPRPDYYGWLSIISKYDWNTSHAMIVLYGPTAICPNGESGGDPNAGRDGPNKGGFQINERVWRPFFGEELWSHVYEPEANTAMAHVIWQRAGGSFSPWSCAP